MRWEVCEGSVHERSDDGVDRASTVDAQLPERITGVVEPALILARVVSAVDAFDQHSEQPERDVVVRVLLMGMPRMSRATLVQVISSKDGYILWNSSLEVGALGQPSTTGHTTNDWPAVSAFLRKSRTLGITAARCFATPGRN